MCRWVNVKVEWTGGVLDEYWTPNICGHGLKACWWMWNSKYLLCSFQSHASIEISEVRRGGICTRTGWRWMIVTWIQDLEVFKFTLGPHRSSYLCWFIFFFYYTSGGVGKNWLPLHWGSQDCNKEVSHGLSWFYWAWRTGRLQSYCHLEWWQSKGWDGGCPLGWQKNIVISLATVK